ncbi:PIN domain-containing protein [Candidatus Poribacteria bacterium]
MQTARIIIKVDSEDVHIPELTKAELMRGAKNEAELLAISDTLSSFEYISLDESVWEEVGRLSCHLR